MARLATATFLFTDIEGSTSLWDERESAMSDALARHDEMMRAAVIDAGGEVVKTTGDGVHAVFDNVGDALTAAAAAQRAVAAEKWGESGALRVRIGIHTGVSEARDGDYFGTTVNRTARLMALANPGQVLVSEATAVLARDTLAPGMELRDLGPHVLRGLTRVERVFQLVAPGLLETFAALRSVETAPSNLPGQVTSFVGRREERTALAALLREHRLVTIIGVGGVGKTRMALELAADAVPLLRDGAWFCELAPANDADAMVDVVAATLGVVDRPGVDRRASVLDFLATKQILLVLDNCEHLLDPAAQLASDVLQRCREVRILATSREPLSVQGEHVSSLRSLPLPSGDELDDLNASDAVRLFVARAEASRSGFTLDSSNGPAVAEICRRLDGMPLAIELAAARVLAMQPAEIAKRLDERFRLLRGGRRASVERHQTLQATVDWSHSLLTDAERLAFARLSVFPGSFDAEAASAVAAGDGLESIDVLDTLGSLATKSMLTTEDGEGTTRFGMLETLRQYGRDRLTDFGTEEAEARYRTHAVHFAELAAELGRQLWSPDELVARQRVGLEIENFRSAISWALEAGNTPDAQLAVRICAGLNYLVSMMPSVGFGAYAERCANAALHAPGGDGFAALGGAVFKAAMSGDLDRARAWSDAAFAAGIPEDVEWYVLPYIGRALLTITTDLTETVRVLREGVEVAQLRADGIGAAAIRTNLSIFLTLNGDAEAGRVEAETALAAGRRLGHPSTVAVGAFVWAMATWIDDPEAARTALAESIALTEAGASDVVSAATLGLLGRIEGQAGNLREAMSLLRGAVLGSLRDGNRLTLGPQLGFAAEFLGAATVEPAVVAVLEGSTQDGAALPMGAIAGRERQIHVEAISAAREQLGAKQFDELVTRGRTMTYEQIVEYARTELDRIIDELGPAPVPEGD